MTTPLEKQLHGEIETRGTIPFSRFMELCLYHPEHGYYARHGPGKDYYTAPQASPLFGKLVARQLAEMWERLGRPDRFDAVDVGAGKGELLDAIYEEARRIPGFREAFMPRAIDPFSRRGSSLTDLSPASITGCILSNELFDALPVHRVRAVKGEWREAFVTLRDGKLRSVLADATAEALDHLEWLGIAPQEGVQLEACPAALPMLEAMAGALSRGFVVTIDYGSEMPEFVERGTTLRCFFAHTVHGNPLDRPGEQDITADVNFTALMRKGEELGLKTLGLTSQMKFLVALGAAEEMAEAMTGGRPAAAAAAKTLVVPGAMGERFKVLVQGKGTGGPLEGLREPFR